MFICTLLSKKYPREAKGENKSLKNPSQSEDQTLEALGKL
jgi:hypothetical protein